MDILHVIACVHEGVKIHLERSTTRLKERVSMASIYKEGNEGVIACGKGRKAARLKVIRSKQ